MLWRTLDRAAGLVDWVNVCRSAGPRQGNANHAVACNDRSELLLRPILGAFGPHRKHHEAALLVGVFDPYLHLGRKHQSEFGEHLARPADQPRR
jgi:hypothetical protein